MASSDESMRSLELFQIKVNEGPCVDCFADGVPIIKHELVDPDERWPRFSPRAIQQGFGSVHCLPMRLRGRTIGALNLFRTNVGLLTTQDVVVAQGLADVATIAILQHQSSLSARLLNNQLRFALNNRIVIEQAKGLISGFASCSTDDAFARWRSHARNLNLRLTDVATNAVDGQLLIGTMDSPRKTSST